VSSPVLHASCHPFMGLVVHPGCTFRPIFWARMLENPLQAKFAEHFFHPLLE